MRENEYRLNLRFDLDDPEQKRIAEELRSIDRKEQGSINSFAIKAIGEYLDRLLRPRRFDFTLEDVRALFREELRDMDFAPREQAPSFIPPSEMTEEEKAENDRSVLETLDMFS